MPTHHRDTPRECSVDPLVPRIVSGSIGSVITALVVTPLEVVKIRQQASLPSDVRNDSHIMSKKKSEVKTFHRGRGTVVLRNGLQLPKSSFPCLVAPGHTDSFTFKKVSRTHMCPRFYESTLCSSGSLASQEISSAGGGNLRMLKSILQSEGVAGLYTGLRSTLLMTVPNTAITLTLYDELIHRVQVESINQSSSATTLLVGSLSRCIASTVTLPLELIRTRQASYMSINGGMAGSAPPGLIEDLRHLTKTSGVGGLYKGLSVTLLRDSSFSGIYFLCLEWFRAQLREFDGIGDGNYYLDQVPPSVTITHNLLSGAGAATVATLLTGPLDTAKTRKQMISNGRSNPYKNLNIYNLIHVIFKKEGISGLWKGNKARCTKVVPASAIMIACYEVGKDIMRNAFH